MIGKGKTRRTTMTTTDAAVTALRRLSARLGRDRLLTQGAGGNTSLKQGDVLLVKASGTWLAWAEEEPIFVPVRLSGVRARIGAGEADPVGPERLPGDSDRPLRPSIETTLHAILPHPVVLHVHSVNAIAWAVRADGEAEVAKRLEGLRWAWIPYVRPGLPLAEAVAQAVARAAPDVVLMANHGLVVGGADCDAAEALLTEVERRLGVSPRAAPPGDLAGLAERAKGTPFRPCGDPEAHGIATDPASLAHATGGTLYPDHLIFLGSGAVALRPGESVAAAARRAATGDGQPPVMLLVPGTGVLVREDLSAGGEAMVSCLADVLRRVPPDAPLVYLSPAQEAELLGWDAEKYRRSLGDSVANRNETER
jgi:rhamnose utilization protein RhaD (predicted bifunctional aldolase and dehydrogenase)